MKNDLSKISDSELRAHLITPDFKGKASKEEVLKELLKREFHRGRMEEKLLISRINENQR